MEDTVPVLLAKIGFYLAVLAFVVIIIIKKKKQVKGSHKNMDEDHQN